VRIFASRPFLRGWKFSLDVSHAASSAILARVSSVLPKAHDRRSPARDSVAARREVVARARASHAKR
jgi:hypothetical protein